MRDRNSLLSLATKLTLAVAMSLFAMASSAVAQDGGHSYIVFSSRHAAKNLVDATRAQRVEVKAAQALATQVGGRNIRELPIIGGFRVVLDDKAVNTLAERASASGFSVEPDAEVRASYTPNDPYYTSDGRNYDAINLPQAWDITLGSNGIVVAVIDTGIDYNHPDLAPNAWKNGGEIPGDGRDNDGNGYVDDYYGYDFVNRDSNPIDDHYHGTHCAGTVAAATNNGNGIAGTAPNARIMALKVLAYNGSGYTSGIIEAVQYAVSQRQRFGEVRVISASLGGGGYSAAFNAAAVAAAEAGIVFVAAAGNNGSSIPSYPAGYPSTVSVGAANNSASPAGFSNYGSWVSVVAPGVDVFSTFPTARGSYGRLSGTSMATPHVAGLAALILSARPALSARQVKQVLMDTATRTLGLRGRTASGYVHAFRAVTTTPSAQISGRMLTPQGVPISGVLVQDSISGRSTTSNANGDYALAGLTSGSSYSIAISKLGYTFTPSAASGTINSDLKINSVGVLPLYRLAGRVAVNGTPLSGASIYDPVLGRRTTDAQGYFSYEGLTAGRTYALTVSKAGYRLEPSTAIGTLASDLELSFNAVPAPYRFGALFVLNGRAFPKVRAVGTIGGAPYSGVSGRNGWLIIDNIPGGTPVNLTFYYSGYVFSRSTYSGVMTETVSLGRINSARRRR